MLGGGRTGGGWSHEVKLDGFRVQLHKVGLAVTLFGKNGGKLTTRFPTIAETVINPVRSCIIDGELIAAGAEGQPDFRALLHGRHVPVCVYAFDLMELDGRDLREQPLEQRRSQLKRLLARSKGNLIRFGDSFPSPLCCWRNAFPSRASCVSARMRRIDQVRAAVG